jgi:hypothetical protein
MCIDLGRSFGSLTWVLAEGQKKYQYRETARIRRDAKTKSVSCGSRDAVRHVMASNTNRRLTSAKQFRGKFMRVGDGARGG